MLLVDATRGGVPAGGAADSTGRLVCAWWDRRPAVHGSDAGMVYWAERAVRWLLVSNFGINLRSPGYPRSGGWLRRHCDRIPAQARRYRGPRDHLHCQEGECRAPATWGIQCMCVSDPSWPPGWSQDACACWRRAGRGSDGIWHRIRYAAQLLVARRST